MSVYSGLRFAVNVLFVQCKLSDATEVGTVEPKLIIDECGLSSPEPVIPCLLYEPAPKHENTLSGLRRPSPLSIAWRCVTMPRVLSACTVRFFR